MSPFFRVVHFPNGTPNPEQIQIRCCERTGVDISSEVYDEKEKIIYCILDSSAFKNGAYLEIQEHLVEVDLFDYSYFHWNVVLALIDLGGLFDGESEILGIVFLPWKERKWWWSWQFMFGGPTRRIRTIDDDGESISLD